MVISSFSNKRAARRLFAALVLALTPAACASDTVTPPPPGPIEPGVSLSGNYLAGRHALTKQDSATAATMLLEALKQEPDNDALRQTAFIAALRNGRVDDALPLARVLVEHDDRTEVALLVLAIDAIRSGASADSLGYLKALDEKQTYRFLIPLLKAWAEVAAGRFDDALAALGPLETREGFETIVTLHKALINDQAGRADDARETFKALEGDDGALSLRLLQLVGAFHERQGDTEHARALYDAYLARRAAVHPVEVAVARMAEDGTPPHYVRTAQDGAAEALMGLGSALSQQNARETAEIFVRLALYLKPEYPTALLLLGGIMEADERADAAIEVYQAIPASSPLSLTAKIRQADNLDQLGRTDEATRLLREIARQRPNDPQPLLDLGDILRRHERFAEAVEAYDDAVRRIGTLSKRHWTVLYTRGIALERSKNWPRAEQDFLRALKFEPEQPLILNYLGYTWVEKGYNLDKAEAMIRQAVKLRPNDGYIVDSLGWILFRLGKPAEAVKEMERAVELQPQDPVINDHLGDVYWTVGRQREAVFQWKRVLGLDPEPDLEEKVRGKIKDGLTPQAGTEK